MTGKTHLLAGILSGEILAYSLDFRLISMPTGLVLCAAALGSLLPDIDHATSTISTANGITRAVSTAVTSVSKHRGVVHTPAFILLITTLLCFTDLIRINYGWQTILAFAVGMISHLVLDSLNPVGIMWLWPLIKDPVHVASIRTRSKAEKTFAALLFAAIAIVTWNSLKAGFPLALSRLVEIVHNI